MSGLYISEHVMAPYVDRPMTPASRDTLQGAFQSHEALASPSNVAPVRAFVSEPALAFAGPERPESSSSLPQSQNPEYRDMDIQLPELGAGARASEGEPVSAPVSIVVPESDDDDDDEEQDKGKAPAEPQPEVRKSMDTPSPLPLLSLSLCLLFTFCA
jgi:hypothetical protein